MAGDAEGLLRSIIGLGKFLLYVFQCKVLFVIKVLEFVRDLDRGKGVLNILEVVGGGKAAARPVFFPFMLDQAATGHVFEHVTGNGTGDRAGRFAVHRRLAAISLWPKTVQDKSGMVAGF